MEIILFFIGWLFFYLPGFFTEEKEKIATGIRERLEREEAERQAQEEERAERPRVRRSKGHLGVVEDEPDYFDISNLEDDDL